MTSSKVVLLCLVQGWFTCNWLHCWSWSILLVHGCLNYKRWVTSNCEVISPQVILFTLIEFSSHTTCMTFIIEVQVGGWSIVLFQLGESLWSRVTIFEMVCLYVVHEVLVNRLMTISFRLVYLLVRCYIASIMGFSKHQVSSLRSNVFIP